MMSLERKSVAYNTQRVASERHPLYPVVRDAAKKCADYVRSGQVPPTDLLNLAKYKIQAPVVEEDSTALFQQEALAGPIVLKDEFPEIIEQYRERLRGRISDGRRAIHHDVSSFSGVLYDGRIERAQFATALAKDSDDF